MQQASQSSTILNHSSCPVQGQQRFKETTSTPQGTLKGVLFPSLRFTALRAATKGGSWQSRTPEIFGHQPVQLQRHFHSRRASRLTASSSDGHVAAQPDVDSLVELGKFGPPHGVGGELRLHAITDSLEERLSQPGRRWSWLQGARSQQPVQLVEIERFRSTVSKGKEIRLVKLKEVDSLEEAEQLQGHTLCMLAEDRPELEGEDEFYVQELIGMQVILRSSRETVGMVTDVYDGTGTHDVLRITLTHKLDLSAAGQTQTALIPFAKEIVPVVDRDCRVLEIDPPEGLLEISSMLKTTTKKKGPRRSKKLAPDVSESAIAV